MRFKSKKEDVSISFHHLSRCRTDGDGGPTFIPLTSEEFGTVHQSLIAAKALNIKDEETDRRIRYRLVTPIQQVERFDNRFIAGIYQASYWGHAYDNSVVGKIPAESINLRPFFFLLYLSESGRIYLASQYLGTFGGYLAIKNTVTSALAGSHEIVAASLYNGGALMQSAEAKEVEIKFCKKGSTITSRSQFGTTGAILFKKQSKYDGFETEVKQSVLSHAHKQPHEIKKALAELLRSNVIMEVNDDDVEDCKVIAVVNGKRKTIHMLDETSYASRYSIDVQLDSDGHPLYEPLKASAIELLKTRIISLREDV